MLRRCGRPLSRVIRVSSGFGIRLDKEAVGHKSLIADMARNSIRTEPRAKNRGREAVRDQHVTVLPTTVHQELEVDVADAAHAGSVDKLTWEHRNLMPRKQIVAVEYILFQG